MKKVKKVKKVQNVNLVKKEENKYADHLEQCFQRIMGFTVKMAMAA